METLIGIDLGTTNCTVTAIDNDGKTFGVKNSAGEYLTPSVVYFTDKKNKVIVGKRAKELSATEPEKVVQFVKREMGKSKECVRENPADGTFEPYEFWGTVYSPEEISAYILKQLKSDAENQLNTEIHKAIITCPAYFGSKEKEATRQAGVIAGFDVMEIMAEPTAAALTYGTQTESNDETVFVFDLGGGTFDVTILRISNDKDGRRVDTIATSGDRRLGGKDWDDYLMSYMTDKFEEEHGIDLYWEKGNEAQCTLGSLRLDVEKAKKEFSKDGVKQIHISLEYQGGKIEEDITAINYEQITDQLTEKCRTYCVKALNEAGITWDDIDTVLMVGSMSRSPFIQKALKKWSGKDIKFGLVDPKSCVSEGAAIRAFTLNGGKTVKTKVINENSPLSDEEIIVEEDKDSEECALGEEEIDRKEVRISQASSVLSASVGIRTIKEGKSFAKKMIEKNQTYPIESTKVFPLAKDGMTEVVLRVLEGESDNPDNCDELGNAVLTLAGTHCKGDKVRVTYSMDKNGILQMSAVDEKTGEQIQTVIQRQGAMTSNDVNEAVEEIEDCELG